MFTATAPGKCILLGEHAVVYGFPAIALSIDIRSYCTVEKTVEKRISSIDIPDYNVNIKWDSTADMKIHFSNDFVQLHEGLVSISKKYDVSTENLKIHLHSDLWKGSGLGSSASTAIAFIHAIETYFNLSLSKKEINEHAFQMEKIVHGTPSGIDNTICCYGGCIVFQKGIREKIITPVLPLLITYSGEPHNTGKVVRTLRKKGNFLNNQFQKIEEIVEDGIKALKSQKYFELGELCNSNQDILMELGLSTPKINEIVSISNENGAYGAKITGAGAGGSVITLGEFSNLRKIQLLLQQKGYSCRICNVDYSGMRIDS